MSVLSSSIVRRTLTGTLIGIGAASVLWGNERDPSGLVPWAMGTAMFALCWLEVARMGLWPAAGLVRALGLSGLGEAVACLLALTVGEDLPSRHPSWVFALASAGLAVLLALGVSRRAGVATTAGYALWFVPPLFGWIAIDAHWGSAGLVSLVVLSKIGDIFGYFVGRAIGRTHPFPNISPGKTTAGCVASTLAAIAAGIGLAQADVLPATPLSGALIGLTINLASQAGDLLESRVKRRAGVKDSGTWLGPSGGFLDLLDSFLLSIPVALLSWSWLLD